MVLVRTLLMAVLIVMGLLAFFQPQDHVSGDSGRATAGGSLS